MVRHYVWDKVPVEMQGEVWKLTSALCIVALLLLLFRAEWWPIFAAFLYEESQVVVCSTWRIFDPWPVPEGAAVCSAKLGIDMGVLGVALVAFALVHLSTRKVL